MLWLFQLFSEQHELWLKFQDDVFLPKNIDCDDGFGIVFSDGYGLKPYIPPILNIDYLKTIREWSQLERMNFEKIGDDIRVL